MSNYFGFTGNNQYTAQNTAYPATATNYVAATAYAAAAAQPRTAYDTSSFQTTGYGTAPSFQGSYGGVTSITPSYDYGAYARVAQATGTVAGTTATGASSAYDTALKTQYGAYSNNTAVKQTYSQTPSAYPANYSTAGSATGSSSATYSSQTAQAATANKSYTGYEAALYNAATSLLHQKSQETKPAVKPQGQAAGGWGAQKRTPYQPQQHQQAKPYGQRPGMGMQRPAPKPQQLHYCDVCKISCAGPQTYKEHLDGQKHKKKEALAKAGQTAIAVPKNAAALRCELCDVACTGSDAYAAHIRGAKHQKVVKLHTRLGKPIPSNEPQLITSSGAIVPSNAVPATAGAAPSAAPANIPVVPQAAAKPKINFAAGKVASSAAAAKGANKPAGAAPKDDKVATEVANAVRILEEEKNVLPIGQEFVEEVKTDDGKVVNYHCKLCDCRFTDPNAKDMHMKGRRHRLAYKKKVDPSLSVEMKPSTRRQRLDAERERRMRLKEETLKKRREEMAATMQEDEGGMWDQFRRHEDEVDYVEYMEWCRQYGSGPRGPRVGPAPSPFPPMGMVPMGMGPMFPQSYDDRHVNAKHQSLYPEEKEMEAIQKTVTVIEKVLKLASDQFAAEDELDAKPGTPVKDESPDTTVPALDAQKKEAPQRVLKGVMRVGRLAKGLILKGDRDVRLIVLCAAVPTIQLLQRVNLAIQSHIKVVDASGSYSIRTDPRNAGLVVTKEADVPVSIRLTLTSPVLRDGAGAEKEGAGAAAPKPPVHVQGALDRQSCLEALASLRHTKWFQARVVGLPNCVLILRILREISRRVPAFKTLKHWALELIAEKVLFSAGQPLSPGAALRRILESISSGFLLEGGPGLLDPCEKEPADAAGNLTTQERLDLTAFAQHALRLFAFRQVYKVLDMEQLPAPRPRGNQGRFGNRKRRRDSAGDGETGEGKKDKREETAAEPTPAVKVENAAK